MTGYNKGRKDREAEVDELYKMTPAQMRAITQTDKRLEQDRRAQVGRKIRDDVEDALPIVATHVLDKLKNMINKELRRRREQEEGKA